MPNALRDLAARKHRLEFVNQAQSAFIRTNRSEWLAELKTDAGTAKAAGVELTLLDCARWFHKAGGISTVAQVARGLGKKALPRRLSALARAYEGPAMRRLGYLLELAGHEPQAKALDPLAQDAKSLKLLDPTSAIEAGEMSGRWKIAVNTFQERNCPKRHVVQPMPPTASTKKSLAIRSIECLVPANRRAMSSSRYM